MTGSLALVYFGLLAMLGSSMAAPAITSAFGKITRPAAVSTSRSAAPAVSSTPAAARKLSFTSPMVYDLDNAPIGFPTISTKSGLKLDASVYIVDMAGHSAAQIKTYKEKGKFVVCYFSAEPFRSDAKSFDPVCACGPGGTLDSSNNCVGGSGKTKMADWDEYWLDLHSETCKANVKTVQAKRIKEAAAKGCDGMDPDNVDSYSNRTPYGTTQADQIDYLLWLSQTVHAAGMVIALKNSPDIIQSSRGAEVVKAFDLSVIESCAVYNECDSYSPFLAAKKPQIQIEYSNSIKSCPKLKAGQTLAVYSGLTLDSKAITLYCAGPKA